MLTTIVIEAWSLIDAGRPNVVRLLDENGQELANIEAKPGENVDAFVEKVGAYHGVSHDVTVVADVRPDVDGPKTREVVGQVVLEV